MCSIDSGREICVLARQMSEVLANRTIENGGDYGKLERMSAMRKRGS